MDNLKKQKLVLAKKSSVISDNSANSIADVASQLKSLSQGNALPSSLMKSWLHVLDCISKWEEQLEEYLNTRYGSRGKKLYSKYRGAFGESYQVMVTPEQAAEDIYDLEASEGKLFISWGKTQKTEKISILKIFSPLSKLPISRVTPVLVHFSFIVEDESSFEIKTAKSAVFLHIFKIRLLNGNIIDNNEMGKMIADCIREALEEKTVHDSLNTLMITAGLATKELELLRTIRNYARQISALPARSEANNTLISHPEASKLLVQIFSSKFSPDNSKRKNLDHLINRFMQYLSSVTSIDEDRTLRVFFNVIESALRTNYFLPESKTIAIKLDCSKIYRMPEPRPWREIYVYGGKVMEGCHLRGGPVARGGIRWSERPADFRTEILGLMKTQITKNAQIVPTGAKGGFVVKRQCDKNNFFAEVESCYRLLISSLLEIQDNLDNNGKVIHQANVVAYDGDDTYLVVAADKGTASFSDVANELSKRYGFWLGDAFASGGSNGFDHKIEGITAKGAWTSAERHFRDLGKNIAKETFIAVGIGDMSGDVFGNGMLLSKNLKLIAAFDHRDIFIDPDPHPTKSLAERKRLFNLKRSSWQDYNKKLLSKGGCVFSRAKKSLALSIEARKVLGISETSIDPDSLIRAILSANVDLLYNGGIGTYVKAGHEHNSEVGDPQNDSVRISAGNLHAKIVVEGGNLGFTQAARIEYALNGGRIYTDAIDNSAGVDLSDHEVNLKILLDGSRKYNSKTRSSLLKKFKSSIIDDVLSDNYEQTLAVALDEIRSRRRLTPFANTIADLEKRGILNSQLEGLPDPDELRDRLKEGVGLTRPELSVLLSYAKIDTKARLYDSPITHKHYLDDFMPLYFAPEIRRELGSEIFKHKLKDNILVTVLTDRLVNLHGSTVIYRMTSELGLSASRVSECLIVASEALDIKTLKKEICRLDGKIPSSIQYEELIRLEESVVLAARWLVRNAPDLRNKLQKTIETYRALPSKFSKFLKNILPERDRNVMEQSAECKVSLGIERSLAEKLSFYEHVPTMLDAFALSRKYNLSLHSSAKTLYEVGDMLRLGYLIEQIRALPARTDWDYSAAADVVADLRRSRRRIASRLMELSMNIDSYCKERYRSTANLQSSIARIESEKPDSVSSYIVISNQLQNLASL
ncbi:MAG: hypothetical protein COS94_00540 [Candidatus Hydrogenedentes bacterium CG07_land_8_20_14_0_80_42_17]|nr:MAG: hypothetical protein COS94_00540 [Candidatus Hydrogenedentes bacterium CG07_land_8_20_14_0_80_42_17]